MERRVVLESQELGVRAEAKLTASFQVPPSFWLFYDPRERTLKCFLESKASDCSASHWKVVFLLHPLRSNLIVSKNYRAVV